MDEFFLKLYLSSRPAYIDPGSGSILLQLLIAGALGALVVLRTSWDRIKRLFDRGQDEDDDQDRESTG